MKQELNNINDKCDCKCDLSKTEINASITKITGQRDGASQGARPTLGSNAGIFPIFGSLFFSVSQVQKKWCMRKKIDQV